MSMAALQVVSKILQTGDAQLIKKYGLSEEHIYDPQYKNAYKFIQSHFDKYGNIPDIATFNITFPELSDYIVNVSETDEYLRDAIWEDHLFHLTSEVISEAAKKAEINSLEGVDYLQSRIPELTQRLTTIGTDIIANSRIRLEAWQSKNKGQIKDFFYSSGFKELDRYIQGLSMSGEEFVVVFARSGRGKTFCVLKMAHESWRSGVRVGIIEPEMTELQIGYRFDTLNAFFANDALMYGRDLGVDTARYEKYIDELEKRSIPLILAHPKEFHGKLTVSKIKTFCLSNNIEYLIIDGLSYIHDERKENGDSRTITLMNISEDLMSLSVEIKIPIVVVVQSNREGAANGGKLSLENVRDSDGIIYSASLVLGLYQKNDAFHIQLMKNRRGVGDITLAYDWDVNYGRFTYIGEGEAAEDAAFAGSEMNTYRPSKVQNTIQRQSRVEADGEDQF